MDHSCGVSYQIRWARQSDWPQAMKMIWDTFMKFEASDYTEEGIQNFKDFLTNGRIYQMFLDGSYLMLVAMEGDRVIGAISVRNRNHISLLFVDEAYHHMGIGSRLIYEMDRFLKENCHEVYVTVKAAPYAIGFYQRLGFHISSAEQKFSGIRVTPMERFL